MRERTVVLLPLRGGSKSIPGKNIRRIAGKPLCAWALAAARSCPGIDDIYVSTDCDRIAEVVEDLGLGVRIVKRPDEFATDTASTESVIAHFAQAVDFDLLATMQATSPLTRTEDLSAALRLMAQGGYDSLVTGVRMRRFFWRENGTALNYDPLHRPRRQDFAGSIMENGAFYLTRRTLFERTGCRLGGSVAVHVMEEESATEIDEPEDWEIVERLLLRRSRERKPIDLLVLDVDGTLTDGSMFYSEGGEQLKRFHARDGLGLRLLRENGMKIALCTSEASGFAAARARKLGIDICLTDVADKAEAVAGLARSLGIPLERVGFMGDDLNDLPALRIVGLPACPSDAAVQVRDICDFISARPGGMGAVRDLADHLIG